MTIQDLQACKHIRDQIDSLDERIARLRSQAGRLSRPPTSLPGGEGDDHLAEYAAKLDELEREHAGQVIALDERLQACEEWIASLPGQQAKVLRLRYIEGLKWGDVAKRANYCQQHCKKIHKAAKEKMRPNAPFFCDKV